MLRDSLGCNMKEQTTKAEKIEEKPVVLPPRPKKRFYEAFHISADGSQSSLGVLIDSGPGKYPLIGVAYRRAYLYANDPASVKKIKLVEIKR